jgi:hypothetical protein
VAPVCRVLTGARCCSSHRFRCKVGHVIALLMERIGQESVILMGANQDAQRRQGDPASEASGHGHTSRPPRLQFGSAIPSSSSAGPLAATLRVVTRTSLPAWTAAWASPPVEPEQQSGNHQNWLGKAHKGAAPTVIRHRYYCPHSAHRDLPDHITIRGRFDRKDRNLNSIRIPLLKRRGWE